MRCRMAKSRGRDTWTEVSGATGAAKRVVEFSLIGLFRERDRQEQTGSWGPGETHFTLNRSRGLPSPTTRTFLKQNKTKQATPPPKPTNNSTSGKT